MDLLQDLPVDPVANAKQPIAVDSMNRSGQRGGDAREQASIVPIVGEPGTNQRDGAPGAAPPPQRGQQQVALDRRLRVADVARQHAAIPVGVFRQREEEIGLRAAGMKRRDAAVSRLKELVGVPEGMAQRLVRLPHVDQANRQRVEEFERGELPILGPHGAIRMVPDVCRGQVLTAR